MSWKCTGCGEFNDDNSIKCVCGFVEGQENDRKHTEIDEQTNNQSYELQPDKRGENREPIQKPRPLLGIILVFIVNYVFLAFDFVFFAEKLRFDENTPIHLLVTAVAFCLALTAGYNYWAFLNAKNSKEPGIAFLLLTGIIPGKILQHGWNNIIGMSIFKKFVTAR
jgi:cation transport ATPase